MNAATHKMLAEELSIQRKLKESSERKIKILEDLFWEDDPFQDDPALIFDDTYRQFSPYVCESEIPSDLGPLEPIPADWVECSASCPVNHFGT